MCGASVRCSILKKPTILLNSHIDTVKPVNGWSKGSVHSPRRKWQIVRAGQQRRRCQRCFVITGVPATMSHFAEITTSSILPRAKKKFQVRTELKVYCRDLPPVSFAIVGEPTEMQPAIAEKGLMVLDVTATGKAGHAARNEGDNAIYKVLDDIAWFRDYRFEKESPLLGPVKMSVTVINAGTQHNVIPDKCSFVVDIRSNELYSNEELFVEIKKHISCDAKARSYRLNSSQIDEKHPFVQKAVKLGRVPFGSPTLSDQALMSFPSVKIGPGRSSRSHTAEEYIMLKEIEEAVGIYLELLDGLLI